MVYKPQGLPRPLFPNRDQFDLCVDKWLPLKIKIWGTWPSSNARSIHRPVIRARPRRNAWAAGNSVELPEGGTGLCQGPTSQVPWSRPKVGRDHSFPILAFAGRPIHVNRGPSRNPEP